MSDIADAYEASYTIMLNLNRSWISKQGDFFVESPIILLAAIIWYLRIYQGGRYCTFPHAIELLNKKYADVFTILRSYPELENYLSPFVDAWESSAVEQLQGQIASAKIPLSRMISPALYWVMTGDDFSLDINNPKEPKILVVGNNPDRQNIYSAALGLYNSRIVKLINKKGQLKSSVIIDELPTIYFRGLDNLIAMRADGEISKEKFGELRQKAENELATLNEELDKLNAVSDELAESLDMNAIKSALDEMIDFSGPTIDENIIEKFVSRITPIDNGHYRWDLNFTQNKKQAIIGSVEGRKGKATADIKEYGENDEHSHRTYDKSIQFSSNGTIAYLCLIAA